MRATRDHDGEAGRPAARRRFRPLRAAAGLAIGLCLGLAYLQTAGPGYRARTSLLLDPRGQAEAGAAEAALALAASDLVLRRAVREGRLGEDPLILRADPLSRLAGRLATASDAAAEEDRAAAVLRRRLEARRSERGLVLDLFATAPTPDEAMRLANAVAQALVASWGETAGALHRPDAEALQRRLSELRRVAEEAEAKLDGYRGAERPGAEDALERQIGQLAALLAEARVKASEAKIKLDRIAQGANGKREPEAVADLVESGAVDRLRAQAVEAVRAEAALKNTLGPLHPAIRDAEQQTRQARKLLSDELRRAADLARAAHEAAEANERSVEQRLSGLQREAEARGGVRRLARDAQDKRRALEAFRRDNGLDREGANLPALRVVSPALRPASPAHPDGPLVLAFSLVGGLVLGAALGLTGRRREASVTLEAAPASAPPETMMGGDAAGPVVADPPAGEILAGDLPWIEGAQALIEVSRRPEGDYARAVRGLRRRLGAEIAPDRPLTILVAGPAGSGRSALAANLAQAFANVTRAALLVDAGAGAPLAKALEPWLGDDGGLFRVVTPPGGQGWSLLAPPAAGRVPESWLASVVRLVRPSFDVVILDGGGPEALADRLVVLAPVSGPSAPGFACFSLRDAPAVEESPVGEPPRTAPARVA